MCLKVFGHIRTTQGYLQNTYTCSFRLIMIQNHVISRGAFSCITKAFSRVIFSYFEDILGKTAWYFFKQRNSSWF
jgi:hypothetical protein